MAFVEFHVTYGERAQASEAAEKAIRKNLAACANILDGVRSIYLWQGQIENETETLCVFKTSLKMADQLDVFLQESHPYETPAIIRHDGVRANASYERWIEEVTLS